LNSVLAGVSGQLLQRLKSVQNAAPLDPSKTNCKAQPTIFFAPEKVAFESTPRLLGVTLDCQLTFGPHTDQLKEKISGWLKVLRSLLGRSWGRNPSSLGSLYCTYVQSCTLYCASSWLASTTTNHLRKLKSQHLAGLDALNPLQQFLFLRKQVFSHSSSMPTSPQPS